jgi:uncharacterized protein
MKLRRTYYNLPFCIVFTFLLIAVASCQPGPFKESVRDATKSIKSFPSPLGLVNDFEKIYTPEQALYLERLLSDFESSTKIQIALVTLDSSLTTKRNLKITR